VCVEVGLAKPKYANILTPFIRRGNRALLYLKELIQVVSPCEAAQAESAPTHIGIAPAGAPKIAVLDRKKSVTILAVAWPFLRFLPTREGSLGPKQHTHIECVFLESPNGIDVLFETTAESFDLN